MQLGRGKEEEGRCSLYFHAVSRQRLQVGEQLGKGDVAEKGRFTTSVLSLCPSNKDQGHVLHLTNVQVAVNLLVGTHDCYKSQFQQSVFLFRFSQRFLIFCRPSYLFFGYELGDE